MKKIQENNFTKNLSFENLSSKIKFCLEYAVLAPSVHNIQPWLFKIKNDSCEIYFDDKLHLNKSDPQKYYAFMAIGASLENLILVSKFLGIFKNLNYFPKGYDNGPVAEIFFEEKERDNSYKKYIELIKNRHNYRGTFLSRKIDKSFLSKLVDLFKEEDYFINSSEIFFLEEEEKIKKIANLTAKGVFMAHKDKGFREEMSGLIHHNLTKKKYGMPGYSLRMPFFLSFIIPSLMKKKNLGKLLGKLNYKSMSTAPVVCIMSLEERNSLNFVKMGRIMERIFLEANSKGIKTSVFVASVEIGDLYKEVQKLINTKLLPSFVFCMGFPTYEYKKLTPKYSLKEKII